MIWRQTHLASEKHETGYRKKAHKFYNSKAWISVRDRVMMDAGYVCAHCGGAATIADHIQELDASTIDDPHQALNHEKCQALCHECHNRKTFRKNEPIAKGLRFDERGELVRMFRSNDELID